MNYQAAASISRENPSLGLVGFDILPKEWDFSLYLLLLSKLVHSWFNSTPVLGVDKEKWSAACPPQTSTLLTIHREKKEVFFILTGPQKPPWIPQNHWAPHHLFLLLLLSATKFSLHLPATKEGKFNTFLSLEHQNTILIYHTENPCNTVGMIYCAFRERSYS